MTQDINKTTLSNLSEAELLQLISSYRAIIQEQDSKLQEQDSKLQEQDSKLQEQSSKLQKQYNEIAGLRYQLNYYLSKKYGKSTDAIPIVEQLSLFDELEEEQQQPLEPDEQPSEVQITIKEHTRAVNTRKPLPKDLPREEMVIDIDEKDKICTCGCGLHRIGEEVSEKLDIIPAVIRVLKIIRPKYACRNCEEGIKTMTMPKTALPKSLASPGTLAHVMLSKYEDHLPLYRQEKIFQRMGIDMPRSTLCNWMLGCANVFKPLYDLMKQDLINSAYIQADETPVQVLQQPKDKSDRHYMWCYLSKSPDKNIIYYDYHHSRSGDVVSEFLTDYKGILHTDGYAGYNKVSWVTHGACWAHARRKFVDIVKNTQKTGIARKVVEYIAQLYKIEQQTKQKMLSPQEIVAIRQLHSKPILKELHDYLTDKIIKVPPKSPIGKAIAYTLKLWDKLNLYLSHGDMPPDTNLVENAIRPFAIGRRNWLFQGHKNGAEASSIIYSILRSCHNNNIEPYAYIKYVLYKIPKIDDSEIKILLPYNIDKNKIVKVYSQILY